MSRFILNAANWLLSAFLTVVLLVAGAYSAYALWDNNQIYVAASNVQADMIKLKPAANADSEEGPSFEELLAVNPDVCAWITMDGTNIDFPVLQGETNLTYINTDVYGNFALAGSIFLDTRCDRNFEGTYSLLYGHHMENSNMFGDLDLYKDEQFFNENRTGTLILPGRIHSLETFACLLVYASDDVIFSPDQWQDDIEGLLDYAQQNALHAADETIAEIRRAIGEAEGERPQIVALSTCSSEFTDARTIVLAVMKDYAPAN